MGGNTSHHYERHEDDEQQQRSTIHGDFRLILGQVDLSLDINQRKRLSFTYKQPRHRKISSSTDQQSSTVSLLIIDIPTSPFDSNELDTHTFVRNLLDQDVYGKELAHLFRIPHINEQKSRSKTLPTIKLAAIYYEQASTTNDLTIDTLSYVDENDFEGKVDLFKDKIILSTYTSSKRSVDYHQSIFIDIILESNIYLISTKNLSKNSQYIWIRSTTMFRTALENFEWFQPFIHYSHIGYRLCGVIPLVNKPPETSLTIYWLFERMEKVHYEPCILEYQWKSSCSNSLINWTSLLNWMSKQEWKLVSTLDYQCKKKTGEQHSCLLFFQKCQN